MPERPRFTSGQQLDLEFVEHGSKVAAPEGFAALRGPGGTHVFVRRSVVVAFALEAAQPEEIAAEIRSLGFTGVEPQWRRPSAGASNSSAHA